MVINPYDPIVETTVVIIPIVLVTVLLSIRRTASPTGTQIQMRVIIRKVSIARKDFT